MIRNRPVLFLVLLNVFLRGLWLWYMHPPQLYDFDWYYTHAVSMLHGEGYKQGNLYTAYWPIGYPFFLRTVFSLTGTTSVIAGLIANALLSIGIVILIYFATRKMTGNMTVSFLAALGYTLLPSQIEWNAVLGSEELYTFLVMLSVFMYLRSEQDRWWIWTAVSGILLGFAADVRPIPLLFPAAILLYEIWMRRQPWRVSLIKTGVFAAAMLVGVCPVTIRNYIALHHFVLISTNGGVNLWQGTKADGSYYWSWDPKVNPLLAAGTDQIAENKIGMHVFIDHVLHHPLWTVIHGVIKIFFLYWVDWNVVSVTFQVTAKKLTNAAMWFDTIVYWLWMIVVFFGMQKKVPWRRIGLPLLFVLYNTAVFFFFPAWDRFRYPLMPFLAILFGYGLERILSRYSWISSAHSYRQVG
ncbi:ArnT family glycosyltransferase [Alicyclobacillus macrosporangiidus]|uniref:ArnT family glycosyltransferase n=1 Tax=Alicyclobacillus macrosporangiidus TaxID=392015 RepID=UPI000A6421EB|nr:glycosyltransferase family 39 protein [Alicyclobacillus macrosporangiidus]MCL6627631.1 glycosyltransferase family 39 protein [Alicyclobacillus shizuokensis]